MVSEFYVTSKVEYECGSFPNSNLEAEKGFYPKIKELYKPHTGNGFFGCIKSKSNENYFVVQVFATPRVHALVKAVLTNEYGYSLGSNFSDARAFLSNALAIRNLIDEVGMVNSVMRESPLR